MLQQEMKRMAQQINSDSNLRVFYFSARWRWQIMFSMDLRDVASSDANGCWYPSTR